MLTRLATTFAALMLMTAAACATDIIDEGQFFSPAAKATANRAIGDLEKKYQHPIHIETYASPPGKTAAEISRLSKRDKDAFYAGWIQQRAQATKAKGLFVLISKEPSHVHAKEGDSLGRAGFTPAARDRVVNAFLTSFREKRYDDGLTKAVAQIGDEFAGGMSKSIKVQDRTAAPAPVPRAEQQPGQEGGMSGWLVIILLVVGGLILFNLLGRAFNGGAGRAYGTPGAGGGFGSGLFGGLLGAFAGNWLYNSFSGSHHGQAYGGEHGPGATGSTDASSGGDFGSSGDFGGGDVGGGGDFGGGDFGGGGDF